MKPRISVVIPLYNKGSHIGRTIQSVLNQTIQDFEIIVVDGHSTDDGPSIVQNYSDPRIHFFLQNSKGVSEARNEGVKYAQSDFIAFLDADDEWLPCHIEELLRLKNCFPSAGLFATYYKIITENKKIQKPNIKYIPPEPWDGLIDHYFRAVTYGESPFLMSSIAIPKQIFTDLNGFLPEWSWAEDHELWGRIALHYPIAYSWKCGVYWHHDAENRLGNQKPPIKRAPLYFTLKKFISENQVDTSKSYEYEELLAAMDIDFSIRLYQSGDLIQAKQVLHQCKTRKLILRKFLWMVIYSLPKQIYLFITSTKNKMKD